MKVKELITFLKTQSEDAIVRFWNFEDLREEDFTVEDISTLETDWNTILLIK